MKLSDFVRVFVVALYNETVLSGKSQFRVKDILDRYSLEIAPAWKDRILNDNELRCYVDIERHIGPARDQRVALSPEGFRWVEDEIGENLASFLEQHGARYVEPPLVNEAGVGEDISVSDHAEAELVPASDRVVPINHNMPEYAQVRDGLANLRTQIHGNNEVGETAEQRDRLLRSLDAASALWDARELKLVQIKVGIILAIEDAGNAFKEIGKMVAIGILIDAVKAVVKACSGIEF